MNTTNAVLTAIADKLFSLLANWPPIVLLLVISVLAGVLMAVVFRFTSRQKSLRRLADLSRAQVLSIKLFKDELGNIFNSLGRLFRYTGLRLWHSLPPALVMAIPFVLLLIQLARWYEHRPLVAGEPVVFEMQLTEDAWPQSAGVVLQSSSTLRIEAEPAHDPQLHTVAWRLRPTVGEPATVSWQLGQEHGEKHIAAATSKQSLCAVDWRLPGSGWWDRIFHPGEPGLDEGSAIEAIVVHYKRRPSPLNVPWWITFVVVSMLSALLVRPLVRVQF